MARSNLSQYSASRSCTAPGQELLAIVGKCFRAFDADVTTSQIAAQVAEDAHLQKPAGLSGCPDRVTGAQACATAPTQTTDPRHPQESHLGLLVLVGQHNSERALSSRLSWVAASNCNALAIRNMAWRQVLKGFQIREDGCSRSRHGWLRNQPAVRPRFHPGPATANHLASVAQSYFAPRCPASSSVATRASLSSR